MALTRLNVLRDTKEDNSQFLLLECIANKNPERQLICWYWARLIAEWPFGAGKLLLKCPNECA